MVLHALNRIDPSNWRKATVQTADGPRNVLEYVPPAAESDHLKPLQDEIQERNQDSSMQMSIRIAMNDPARSSPESAAAAVKWAQAVVDKPAGNETEQWMRAEAVVSAAMIAARDGGPDLIAAHGDWIRETFKGAYNGNEDHAHRMRGGLQYNPFAIAFLGTALLLKNSFDMEDVRKLLESAGARNPAAAQGFDHAAGILQAIDGRLIRAILRCAFAACVHPSRQWDMPEEDYTERVEARRREVASAIQAEVASLQGSGAEPDWPSFESSRTDSRHHFRRRERAQPEERPALYTDHQAAALWLGKAADTFDVSKQPWLRDLAKSYLTWTAVGNGSDLSKEDDPDRTPHEWNRVYFNLVARCLPGLTIPQIDELALGLILELPGEAFLDAMTIFLRSVDEVFFNDKLLSDAEAVHIRTALARRLMTSRQWEWHRRDLSDTMTTHLGPAIAALFFSDFGHFQPAKCYLFPQAIERLGPFLSLLKELAEAGPFLSVATTLLNLLEVSPKPAHLPVICAAAKSWLTAHPESSEFWIGQAVGRRVCVVIEKIFALQPGLFAMDQPPRREIDDLLGKLIRLGVAEAHRLEEALRQDDQS